MNDPNYIDQIYTGAGQRREKYKTTTNPVMADGSILTIHDHDLHKRRRAALNPYFSKQNVRRLEPVFNDSLNNLLHRMDQWAKTDEPASIYMAYQGNQRYHPCICLREGEKYLEMEEVWNAKHRPERRTIFHDIVNSDMPYPNEFPNGSKLESLPYLVSNVL
jgi:hypothetical protein